MERLKRKLKLKEGTLSQILIVATVILFFFTAACIDKRGDFQLYRSAFVLTAAGDVACVVGWLRLVIKKDIFHKYKMERLVGGLRHNKWCLFALIYTLTVRIIQIGDLPKWDGGFYYGSLVEACQKFDFTFSQFYNTFWAATHPIWGYNAIQAIGEFLSSGQYVGVFTVNVILAMLAMYCLYQITEEILPEEDGKFSALSVCLISSLPLFLGTFSNYNPDMGHVYFGIFVLYCYLFQKRILMLFSMLLLLTSKEIGALVLGGFAVGIFLWRFFTKKDKLIKRIRYAFEEPFCLITAIIGTIGVTGLSVYLANGGYYWSMSSHSTSGMPLSTVTFIPAFILENLKQFYVLNFNWLIAGIMAICGVLVCITCLRHKNRFQLKNTGILAGMAGGYLFEVLFYCLYIAYVLPRYHIMIDVLGAFFMIILVAKCIGNKNVRNALLGGICVILLTQAYMTVDPVSKIVFPTCDTESLPILSADGTPSGDNTVYNNHYTFMDKAADMVLKETRYDGEMDIVMYDWLRDLNAQNIYWNTETHRRTFAQSEATVPVNVILGKELDTGAAQHNRAIYIYYPQIDDMMDIWLDSLQGYYKIIYNGEVYVAGKGNVYYWVCELLEQ